MYPEATLIDEIIKTAQTVVIIQADNPDGDSLSSALAVEQIMHELGKQPHLYCAVDMPDYLKHLAGWDRVSKEMPTKFDASIIVDTSAIMLLEKLEQSPQRSWVAARPVIVLDHHAEVVCDIPYAAVVLNSGKAVATGEVVYHLAQQLEWPLNLTAKTCLVSSILADSLGLSSEGTTADTYRIMADLIESGVDRPALEEARRALSKMPQSILRYKAKLIERAEFLADNRVALVEIPYNEIVEFSPLYNPGPLIMPDLLQTEGVQVAIELKQYQDNKVTGTIRCGYGAKIADELAKQFGGGGHPYASGFKITDGRPFSQVKADCIRIAGELLDADDDGSKHDKGTS